MAEQSSDRPLGWVIPGHDPYVVERTQVLGTFGAQLRRLRAQRGLSQEGLAEVADLHRNEIGVLERGQCEPHLMTLLILTDTLEVSLCALCDGLSVPRERRPWRGSPRRRGC